MTGSKNNKKKVVKAISVVLSIYMTLSPMVVYADELSDAENNVSAQIEFEEKIADVDVSDIESKNTLEDAAILVENEINNIENEAIKEATEAIVNVDMSNVDNALDKVTEIIDNTLTDETVATEIVSSADALISVYDAQADAALDVLKEISKNSDAVTLLDDGSVSVNWTVATKEVQDLYDEYKKALEAKEAAELEKDRAIDLEKKKAASNKVDELNVNIINKNKEKNEKISESKLDRNNAINSIIDEVAENKAALFEAKYTYDSNIEGTDDIYRFYVNTVKDGNVYGCLTYYDSVNKTILRKNFSISADGNIDYEYIPQPEWVKGDANCKTTPIFGNGSNYIAAYVGNNTSSYISSEGFKGVDVSNLMRANVEINSVIDERNKAVAVLKEIEAIAEKVENDIADATKNAEKALTKYKEAVAMYKDVASLEDEIKKSEVEKAKLEYVKAEVEVWRKQQDLDQIREAINNAGKSEVVEKNNIVAQANVKEVVNNIANNLGVEAEDVEILVVQAIIDTENNVVEYADEQAAVEETIRDEVEVSEAFAANDEAQEVITIEDNQVPLANFTADINVDSDASYVMSLWQRFLIILACVTWVIFVVAKEKQRKERY